MNSAYKMSLTDTQTDIIRDEYDKVIMESFQMGAPGILIAQVNLAISTDDPAWIVTEFIPNHIALKIIDVMKEYYEQEKDKCHNTQQLQAVGNHIPANTPVENALWYNECYEKMKKR